MDDPKTENDQGHIAVIGMALRFPGANDEHAFWQNLENGVDSITQLSTAQLIAAGVSEEELKRKNYVRYRPILNGIDKFDSDFFGLSPRDSEILDPQIRFFLQCVWEALESAGYDPDIYKGLIGVFAGMGQNSYFLNNLREAPNQMQNIDGLEILIANNRDYLPTRTSYLLNLTGPSVNVQTACSTSLVATHLACQSLLNGECDMALVGGSSIRVPQDRGYPYQEGKILSADGQCRTFDASATGTVFGSGTGVVLLKRLDDALLDRDPVRAVIAGSAINNDGSSKVGFTAPGIEGQAAVVAEALAVANVDAGDISYVEAHGTGTRLGDPIEVAALSKAFRSFTDKKRYCKIGSVKTNIGHLDSAAGVAGLIKTILALENEKIPPSLNFKKPNPDIDFATGPFAVNDSLTPWPKGIKPRYAGVSSFGIGGTNAHIVLKEAPACAQSGNARAAQLFTFSARTDEALSQAANNLAIHFSRIDEDTFADTAFTTHVGRRRFSHCGYIVARDKFEAENKLTEGQYPTQHADSRNSKGALAFMFPGQGSQSIQMAADLYKSEPLFREGIDHGAVVFAEETGLDILEILYPPSGDEEAAATTLLQTRFAQPAIFLVEYALAKLLIAWGIKPEAMIGHSVGEYVAATIAGVFTYEEAMRIVALRGGLMQGLPSGAMTGVLLSEQKLLNRLPAGVSIAAVNHPDSCVLSGSFEMIDTVESELAEDSIASVRVATSHAFHSHFMDPILDELTARIAEVSLRPPSCPFVSTVTGDWITDAQATDPKYWANHVRATVRFSDGLATLMAHDDFIFLEVGHGRILSSSAQRHPNKKPEHKVAHTLVKSGDSDDLDQMLNALGKLWMFGVEIDWDQFHSIEESRRTLLPTYPFQGRRYWVEPETLRLPGPNPYVLGELQHRDSIQDFLYRPIWHIQNNPGTAEIKAARWLVFARDDLPSKNFIASLKRNGHSVIKVIPGSQYERKSADSFVIRLGNRNDLRALVAGTFQGAEAPMYIAHLWLLDNPDELPIHTMWDSELQDTGFHTIVHLAEALSAAAPIAIICITNNMQAVNGPEVRNPGKATMLGAIRVIRKEYPNLLYRSIDLDATEWEDSGTYDSDFFETLIEEVEAPKDDCIVAYRSGARYVQRLEPLRENPVSNPVVLREDGVYLITGGLGGIGQTLAEHIASNVSAKLVLIGRSPFPERSEWINLRDDEKASPKLRERLDQLLKLEALGAEVLVRTVDVGDETVLEALRDEIMALYGSIHGIIHSAGVPDGALIRRRDPGMSESVFAPKVKGTFNLDSVFSQVELDFFLICSSLASASSPAGQVAYCGASTFLDAFSHFRSGRRSGMTMALGWDAWSEVGMAVDTLSGLPESHTTPEASVVGHPLFMSVEQTGEGVVFRSQWSNGFWLFDEHRVAEQPTLPGTGYLELIRAAYEYHVGVAGIEFNDLFFFQPLYIPDGKSANVETVFISRGQDAFDVEVSTLDPSAADGRVLHAKGHVKPVGSSHSLVSDWQSLESDNRIQIEKGSRLLTFGAHWDNRLSIAVDESRGEGEFQLLKQFEDECNDYGLHPALLDNATGFLAARLKGAGRNYLPFKYGKIRVHGHIPSHIHVRAEGSTDGDRALLLNVEILDKEGQRLVEIEDYMLMQVDPKNVGKSAPSDEDNISETSQVILPGEENFLLRPSTKGDVSSLQFSPAKRATPGSDEVEIEVYAAGLNFKDLLLTLDMIKTNHLVEHGLGFECSGVVSAVGSSVTRFKPGDAVIAHGGSCFSRFVCQKEDAVAHMPANISFHEAATLLVAFLTARYSLVETARLLPGERVLIHSAAGGVGLAAVQIAREIGAEIYATAGTEAKRNYLKSIGVTHVSDSHSLEFADSINEHTNHEGVDVVLNSLAGEFIPKGISLLRENGRFIEIGLRDIQAGMKLDLTPFERGLTFSSLIIDPKRHQLLEPLNAIIRGLESGIYTPLPHKVFGMSGVSGAVDEMLRSRHIGKLVLSSVDGKSPRKIETRTNTQHIKKDVPHGLTNAEGIKVFEKVLTLSTPHIIVSKRPRDIHGRISEDFKITSQASLPVAPAQHMTKTVYPRPALDTPYLEPSTEAEQALIEIWGEILGIVGIGIDDDFFELGGNSLLATQVITRLQDRFGVQLPLGILFDEPTIRGIALKVEQLCKGDGDEKEVFEI